MAELDAAGIAYQVYNQNAPHLGPYAGGTVPEIHVRGPDMERAGELVRVLFESPDAVEPAPRARGRVGGRDCRCGRKPAAAGGGGGVRHAPRSARRGGGARVARIAGLCPRMVRRRPSRPGSGRRAATSSASPPSTWTGRGRSSTVRKTSPRRKARMLPPLQVVAGLHRSGASGETSSATWPGAPRRSFTKECLACHRQWRVDATATKHDASRPARAGGDTTVRVIPPPPPLPRRVPAPAIGRSRSSRPGSFPPRRCRRAR